MKFNDFVMKLAKNCGLEDYPEDLAFLERALDAIRRSTDQDFYVNIVDPNSDRNLRDHEIIIRPEWDSYNDTVEIVVPFDNEATKPKKSPTIPDEDLDDRVFNARLGEHIAG
jgi:hypothetical protein